jgi:type I restriction enzyme, S subunit
MWKTVKLGDVVKKTDTINPQLSPEKKFRYIDVSSVSKEELRIIETQTLLGKDAPSRARRLVKENDVIFATIRPTLTRAACIPSELEGQVCSTGYIVLRSIEEVHYKYLFYWLISSGFIYAMGEIQTGASYPAVTDKQVKEQPFRYPPLAEQQRIVEKLDAAFAEIDEAIALANAKETEVDKLKATLLTAWLSGDVDGVMWKAVKLGDVLTIARGGSPRPIKSFITTDGDGVNWIKIGDSEEGGKYIFGTKEKIKKSGISRSRYVNEGDFLLSNSMSFGRPYILKTDGCIHDGWLVLSDYESLFDADYLYYLLSAKVVQQQFENSARGSTVRNLNIDLVSKVVVTVPPLAEQQRIVEKLDAAFSEVKAATNGVEEMKTNYKALKSAILAQELQSEAA